MRYITLKEGFAGGQYVLAERAGTGEKASFAPEPGVLYPVVPDDSPAFGIGETMAVSFVERGQFEWAEGDTGGGEAGTAEPDRQPVAPPAGDAPEPLPLPAAPPADPAPVEETPPAPADFAEVAAPGHPEDTAIQGE